MNEDGAWQRIDTRKQLDGIVENQKNEAVLALFAAVLRLGIQEMPENVMGFVGAAMAKAWPLVESNIDERVAELRTKIPPELTPVNGGGTYL